MTIPTLSNTLPEVVAFTQNLEADYQAGTLNNWDDLDTRVKTFFNTDEPHAIIKMIPAWEQMRTFANGRTQTHIIAVLMGLYRSPEYDALTSEQRAIAEWVVIFHDVAKVVIRGIISHDPLHGFRSGAIAGLNLATIGFPIEDMARLQRWYDLTYHANRPYKPAEAPLDNYAKNILESATMRPDNRQLPQIISELDAIHSCAAALIVKGALFHISLVTDPDYPIPSPLTDDEIKRYITPDVYPILRTMMLVDTDGWYLFRPERMAEMKAYTRKTFEHVQAVIGI
jgi:hypothetical protein